MTNIVKDKEKFRSPTPTFLNAEDLASILQVPTKTIRSLARKNRIPFLRVGKHYRFWLGEVVESLKEGAICVQPTCKGDPLSVLDNVVLSRSLKTRKQISPLNGGTYANR